MNEKTFDTTDRLVTSPEAAEILRVSTSFLAKERMKGSGPRYVKVGRAVRYAISALADYVAQRSVGSTMGPTQEGRAPDRGVRKHHCQSAGKTMIKLNSE
jgi:predicted DNA-binding transcriptional regulator AlpA